MQLNWNNTEVGNLSEWVDGVGAVNVSALVQTPKFQ